MDLSATFFLCFLVLVFAEVPIIEIPQYMAAPPCAQNCIHAVSWEYSIDLGCPTSNPAACLCSLGPETLLASAVLICCNTHCTDTATTALALETPYFQNSAQAAITSYCQVNGYSTPTVPPNPTTLVAASELSQLPSAQATGTGSVGPSASSFSVTSNTPFTTIFSTTLIPYPTLQGNSNSTSQSTGDTSPGLSAAAIGGIVVVTLVICVFICVMLWLQNPRQRCSQFYTYVNRMWAGHRHETLQEKCSDSSSTVSEILPNNLSTTLPRPSSISNQDPAHLFQPEDVQDQSIRVPSSQGRAPTSFSLSASPPQGNSEKINWNQDILLYSFRRDKWISAIAILDTGTSKNWIHPRFVGTNGFDTEPTDGLTYTGAHGDSLAPDHA